MEAKYIFLTGELFERVQMEQVFPDGKTFVDCTPKEDLSVILSLYEKEKGAASFSLSAFVQHHFSTPEEYGGDFRSDRDMPVEKHLEQLWDVLTRVPVKTTGSLIELPHPYIVPGGRFREIYYWDSYFTMLGLQVSEKIDLIENMVDNFAYLIDSIGYIPNGNRAYYLGRSQPPFFACMVRLLSEQKGRNVLVKYLPQLLKEYQFWMQGKEDLSEENRFQSRVALMDDGSVLNHYWDENESPRPESFREDTELAGHYADKKGLYRNIRAAAESGWDFSSRWFKNGKDFDTIHTTELIPVDLNCLICHLEKTIAQAYSLNKDLDSMGVFSRLAENRSAAILHYCWNDQSGAFVDYDYRTHRQEESLTLATAFPLFFQIATDGQAQAVSAVIESHFLKPGGLLTTTRTTRQQWDAPNGWAPLQWIAVKGLLNYGHATLAEEIARRWMSINEKVYRATGKMMEKYNVEGTDLIAGGGEYPAQDGFGWTNGVYLALRKLFEKI